MADADLIADRIPLSVDRILEPVDRLRSTLFRRKDWGALQELRWFQDRFTLNLRQTTAAWRDGILDVHTRGYLQVRGDVPYPVERQAGHWHLDMTGVHPREPLGMAVTSIDASLTRAYVELSVYGRESGVEWPVPSTFEIAVVESEVRTIGFRVGGSIDPRTGAMGSPLDGGTWDVMVQFSALGHDVRRRVPAVGLALSVQDQVVLSACR